MCLVVELDGWWVSQCWGREGVAAVCHAQIIRGRLDQGYPPPTPIPQGGTEALMGLSLSVTCAAETLVFWWFPVLLRMLGIPRCLHLVFLGFLLRLGGYWALALAPGPVWVLPLESLHGLTFALAWAGAPAGQGSQGGLPMPPPWPLPSALAVRLGS